MVRIGAFWIFLLVLAPCQAQHSLVLMSDFGNKDAAVASMKGVAVGVSGDLHIYENHMNQARVQRTRDPRPAPKLGIEDSIGSIFDLRPEHLELRSYDPHPGLKGKVAV